MGRHIILWYYDYYYYYYYHYAIDTRRGTIFIITHRIWYNILNRSKHNVTCARNVQSKMLHLIFKKTPIHLLTLWLSVMKFLNNSISKIGIYNIIYVTNYYKCAMLTCVLITDLVAQVLSQVILRVFRQIECIVSNTRISFEHLHQSFCHQWTRLFSRDFPVAVNFVYE